ncbi:MAG: hypothetical protein RIR48_1593 [Bacteroidota bacterium]
MCTKFAETSNIWKRQMVLTFLPWRYDVADNSESTLRFRNAVTNIKIADKEMEPLFLELEKSKSRHFEKYVKQLTKMRTAKKKVMAKLKSQERALDGVLNEGDYTDQWQDSEDEQYIAALDQKDIDSIIHNRWTENMSKPNVLECITKARQYGLFDNFLEEANSHDLGRVYLNEKLLHDCEKWCQIGIQESMNKLTYYENMVKTNPEQLFAYSIIKTHIDAYINSSKNCEPFNLLISGQAGTGKSNIIHCSREYLKNKDLGNELVVGAYTGMAANNIDGELICSRMGLTPATDNRRVKRKNGDINLSNDQLKIYKERNENIKFIFVDECWT